MTPWIALSAVVALILAVSAWSLGRARARRLARERLFDSLPGGADDPLVDRVADRRRFTRRAWWAPWLAGAVVLTTLTLALRLPWSYSAAAAFLAGLLCAQLDSLRVAALEDRIETQLADMIDLMIAALKAGASQHDALDRCAHESRRPLRRELEEVVGRLQYGDNPQDVLASLAERIPLETFRLFAITLSVNWDVGGRLSGTLASVGRTIRDRIELSRRMRAMTTQTRVSVVAILLVSYFVGALMWRNDPDRMGRFLSSLVGQGLTVTAMVLQGLGMVWISRMSRPKF